MQILLLSDDYSLAQKWHAGNTTRVCALRAVPPFSARLCSEPPEHYLRTVLHHVPSATQHTGADLTYRLSSWDTILLNL
jgi:hypothetical protein